MKISFAIVLSILLSCAARTNAQIVYPPNYTALCNTPYRIVLLGSSTTFGSGATPLDSSWGRKFATYVGRQNSQSTIVNLGLPGFTSYHLMPTGYVPPANRPHPVDVTHNITAALALNPDAIILNLPSNDIALGVTVAEVKANFDVIVAQAASAKVPVWVTTTQPRNGISPNEGLMQFELKNWILQHYGNKAVDFWTDIANPNHTINAVYNADNVHVNNAGHHLFFTRMVEEKIWDSICLRRAQNIPLPVTLVQFKATYNGVASELNWVTASEQNSDHFEIQRSADGVQFTAIGSVAAAGNGTSSKNYAFTDGVPLPGNNYYRLKMVDIDDRFKYSVVILVKSADSKKGITVYPNPVKENVQMTWKNMERGTYTVDILLPTGQLLKSYRIGINGPYQVLSINRENNWKKGIYLLRISSSNKNAFTQKLILD
jgi:lysophospholipase L1-like esterase